MANKINPEHACITASKNAHRFTVTSNHLRGRAKAILVAERRVGANQTGMMFGDRKYVRFDEITNRSHPDMVCNYVELLDSSPHITLCNGVRVPNAEVRHGPAEHYRFFEYYPMDRDQIPCVTQVCKSCPFKLHCMTSQVYIGIFVELYMTDWANYTKGHFTHPRFQAACQSNSRTYAYMCPIKAMYGTTDLTRSVIDRFSHENIKVVTASYGEFTTKGGGPKTQLLIGSKLW